MEDTKKQQEDFMKEMWDNYKVTNDIEYLARASEEAPFFGQSEMSLEIATKLRQLKSKINLNYLFHKYYAGFELKTIQTESKEIIPFLEILSVQKARQAYRPEYFSQSLASSLSIDEVEDIWSCISERDDWTKFEKKIKIIKNYGAALRLE